MEENFSSHSFAYITALPSFRVFQADSVASAREERWACFFAQALVSVSFIAIAWHWYTNSSGNPSDAYVVLHTIARIRHITDRVIMLSPNAPVHARWRVNADDAWNRLLVDVL